MSKLLGSALRSARQSAGLSQFEVGDKLGVSKAAVGQWERGVNEPSTAHLLSLCELLKIDVTAATGGLVQLTEYKPSSGIADEDDKAFIVKDRRPEVMATSQVVRSQKEYVDSEAPRADIAIMQTRAVRGLSVTADGRTVYPDFIISNEISDLLQRPVGLYYVKRIAAIYVSDNRNSPRYEIGELIVFQLDRVPRERDFVIIRYVFGPEEDDDSCSFANIGRILLETEDTVVIEQLQGKRDLEISKADILSMDRIFSTHELFGK